MIMTLLFGLLGAARSFEDRFANPPAESRILPIVHTLPDEPEKQDELFDRLLTKGCGGITTNVSFSGGYVESEDRWKAFLRAVPEARRRGMSLWLYDEKGYPSGNAGGITLRDHPEWEARGLLAVQARCGEGHAVLNLPPGRLVHAMAYPVREGRMDDSGINLSGLAANGSITWKAPAGNWFLLAVTECRLYEGTHAELSLADRLPYINLLMPEPTKRFIEVTHQRYADRLGADLGRYFVSTFTDEPSLMSMFLKKQPFMPLPWSPNLPGEFLARRGYALEPAVPKLIADIGPDTAKTRHDFWRTVGELVAENFFGQIQAWCRAHDVLSGGHLLMEEDILTHVPLYGDFYRCLCRLDAPSMDCLTSIPHEAPWYVARLIGSVADLHGREVTMSETSDHCQCYRPKGDERPVYQVTEDEIRGTCNRLIMNGITTITSYYRFAGLSDEQLARLNEWVGRCCTALKGGRQVADVALVYPVESLWPRFTPSREWVRDASAAAHQIADAYRLACNQLYETRRDFTILDGQALAEARVRGGRLELGGMAWRIIVLPGVDTLPLDAWRNLERFWREGGVIVAIGALPANSDSAFPSDEVGAIRTAIFGNGASGRYCENNRAGVGLYLSYGAQRLLSSALNAFIGRDVAYPEGSPLPATHRRIGGREVFFVVNDSAQPWRGAVSFAAKGAGEQWDPATGRMTAVGGPKEIPLELGPFGGMIFRFRKAAPPERTHLETDEVTGRSEALPEVPPIVLRGAHVRENVDVNGQTATAVAVLEKSGTNSFLFLEYAYPEPQDLRGKRFVTMNLSIPGRQEASTPVLVVAADADGREYFIESGVRLGTAGEAACILPLFKFERAGWRENQPEGPLNLAKIRAIRVGWGGHYGQQGDTLAFTVTAPALIP
ncbi:MAG TPA: glycosyl hydrolase [Candidatus Hydrogenedentes bacterium]|nr:glycosyl hydrolase [Candidatus Hydrogenedentota bacterium]HRT19090.1 glycosyl hydrolase [Candidatus Hydrogenedentota bacterium]HRT64019.1 glycosyl hydrolase [Candidatus Hydrogenedentota bacterium]